MSEISLLFSTQEDWRAWLQQNHGKSEGVWLRIAKKSAGVPSVSYAEALDVALCYGWIDGQKRPGPEGFWLQRFTPRRSTSIWSAINREKALTLIKEGRMEHPGLEAIERAKENGRWEAAYDRFGAAQIPEDLAAQLRQRPRANAFFQTLSSQNRYAILFRLQTAKKLETRAKRLEKFVGMLENQQTIYPQSFKSGRSRQKS
ncbi:MAG TPA: YdeI/OmpD-associated family protein [Bryobacteraceae bacterium]|nr:YdeI/OmpD-associated family protein [Bryobacteraceae bacterium]